MIKLTDSELKSMRPSPEEVRSSKHFPVCVLLENIRSLYNVGSFFRTCDGAGVEKLYLCGYTGMPPRKEIDKTALGSTESVAWEHHPDPLALALKLREAGYQLVALEHTKNSFHYRKAEYDFPVCICLGNEVQGLSQELLDLCHIAVEIPMYGVKQSLNVSVAGGIIIYEMVAACSSLAIKE